MKRGVAMRLTDKDKNGEYFSIAESKVFDEEQQAIDKLGQLEDIEDELHINFLDLTCYFKNYHNEIIKANIIGVDFRNKKLIIELECDSKNIFLIGQDTYGKTWALTREELI